MMKVLRYSLILGLVLMVTASSHASEVNNVELAYKDGHTLARVAIDGPVRYTHQSEIAKDGKPYRVIVDVLSATHELGAKKFTRLPNCAISALRTSQYAVNPEKVVRLVFDMKNETVYKVSSDENSVTVSFPDKQTVTFASWSTAQVVKALNSVISPSPKIAKVDVVSQTTVSVKAPAKSAKEINNSIESDRQQSLASKPAKPVPPTVTKSASKEIKTVSKPVVKPASELAVSSKNLEPEVAETSPQTAEQHENSFAANLNYSPVPQAKASATPSNKKSDSQSTKKVSTDSKPVAPAKSTTKSTVTKPAPVKSNSAKQTPPAFENKKPVMAKASTEKPAAKPKADKQPSSKAAVAKAVKKESKTKPVAKADQPKKAAEKVKVASKDAESTTKSTSRFRRAAKDRKIQGTMVAEFPKRLVIKYHSKARRDPFETLVNEKKVSNSPTAKRIPNVEGLKLVGVILADNGKNQALFEDKQGFGYIMKSGDKVRKGYVLRVEEHRVYFQIFEYGWSRTVALNLEEN
ncbi:MAG: AMIN domain-containing protein [bacterium]|nr:AMIN domain-containing protein [bacterium]